MTNLIRLGHAGAPAPGPAAVAPDESGSMGGRIWFAQMLRGVAALMVVYYHLAELYWKDNAYTLNGVFLTPGSKPSVPWCDKLTSFFGHNRMELGDIGVAIFFLISGFVIPFSLAKVGGATFFVRRLFRIYPTYVIGLSLTTLALLINSRVSGIPLTFGWAAFLANAALLFDVFPASSIDSVNWTLIIEMRFYVLCVLLTLFVPLRDWRLLAAVMVILCVANVLGSTRFPSWLMRYIGYAPYLTFMSIGICFYNLIRHDWSPATFGLVLALLVVCFYVNASFTLTKTWRVRVLHAYTLAAVVFSLAYCFRGLLKPSAVMDFFAQISFPLYVIHAQIGYSLMYFFHYLHQAPLLNLLEALALLIPLAWLLHVLVEVPSNRFGHRLTRQWLAISQNSLLRS